MKFLAAPSGERHFGQIMAAPSDKSIVDRRRAGVRVHG